MTISKLSDSVIKYGFYALFCITPFILTSVNYELFEYNKMMAVYAVTTIIVAAWITRMVVSKKIVFQRTFLDIPLALFLISQIISTVFSIDPHVSFWGYYSRFNGGLLSIITYILLYYAFVSNFPKEKIGTLIKLIIFSGLIVAFYGTLEHFGMSPSCLFITGNIGVSCWVQDVQNRVFATLGQPNWLAAYLTILIPLAFGLGLSNFRNSDEDQKGKTQNPNYKYQTNSKFQIPNTPFSNFGLLGYWVISIIFYVTLIFTKSRSGFIGFWGVNIFFWLLLFVRYKKSVLKSLLILNSLFLILNFIYGFTYPQQLSNINLTTVTSIFQNKPETGNRKPETETPPKPTGDSIIDVGVTESGKIRQIVWKGAIDIFKNNPLIGTGVETFAFSYYKFRPVEHNMTSEWDFLYNKAHNEYLNYAATTGAFGLGSYLLFIGSFIFWYLRKVKCQMSNVKSNPNAKISNYLDFGIDPDLIGVDLSLWILTFGFFCGWLTILVTNFFGFSVVLIQLFFYLIPAILFVLAKEENAANSNITIKQSHYRLNNPENTSLNTLQYFLLIIILIGVLIILNKLRTVWVADTFFATGYHESRAQNYTNAFENLKQAIILNPDEPLYYDEYSVPAASLSYALLEQKDATLSSQLKEEAILASNKAISISPSNVNFWKTRTRVFYALSQIDQGYLAYSVQSLEKAMKLSPTDPKIVYNLALIKDQVGKEVETIPLLEKAVKLKPDFYDAYIALGLYYEKGKNIIKAKETYQYILKYLRPDDETATKKLEELK